MKQRYLYVDLFEVIAIFVLCLKYQPKNLIMNDAIRVISVNILGIYFVHEILICATRDFLKSYAVFCNLWVTVIYAIVLIGCSLLLILGIKKIPYVNKLL